MTEYQTYIRSILDRRIKMCVDRGDKIFAKWGRRLEAPIPPGLVEDREFLEKYAVGVGVDVCCGDFLIEDAIGVDTRRTVLGADFHFSADTLSFQTPDSLDYVVSNYLEAVPNTIGALNEWYRCLKVGGTLAMVCRNADSYDMRVYPAGALESGHRQHTFNKITLTHYLHRSGFVAVEIKENNVGTLRVLAKKPMK